MRLLLGACYDRVTTSLPPSKGEYVLICILAVIVLPLRQHLVKVIQRCCESFLEAHFDHFFHTLKRFIYNGDPDYCSAILFTKAQVPVRTRPLRIFFSIFVGE